jgi:DNA end-binding protein Ku
VPASAYEFPSAKELRAAELKTARMLVDELTAEWSPEKYTDDYRKNLLRIIAAKQKGCEAKLEDTGEERTGNVVDLMERLRKSLAGSGARKTASKTAAVKASGAKKKKKAKRPSRSAA